MKMTRVDLPGGGYMDVSETVYIPPIGLPPGFPSKPEPRPLRSGLLATISSVLVGLGRVQLRAAFALRSSERFSLSVQTDDAASDEQHLSKVERRGLAKVEKQVNELADEMKYFIIVLEHKGGVGKSLITQVSYEAVGGEGRRVLILDADFVNKNMSRIGLSEKKNALRADRKDFEGFLLDAAEQLELGDVHAVVIDSAAGSEHHFNRHLAELAIGLKVAGARLIIARPLTTNPLNQDNIVDFGRKYMTADMGVVLVRNLGQGRTEEDFTVWMESPERKEMRALGMVEVDLEGAQVLYADVAAACGISLADIARRKPEEMGLKGRSREIALQFFGRPARLYMARWMLRQTVAFRGAFAAAIKRTVR